MTDVLNQVNDKMIEVENQGPLLDLRELFEDVSGFSVIFSLF